MDYPIKTVCVVGLGYIGLPTAATLASRGIDVIGVDINPRVVEAVNAGQTYFSEPDLDMLLRAATTLRKLRATAQPEPADAFVIAVPTPFREDRSPNLDYIDLAADAIAPVLVSGNVVILESTSPVGTTGRLADRLARLRPDLRFPPTRHSEPLDVHVAHCPERVLPGRMVRELIENDRIVGGMTDACAEHAEAVYRVFLQAKVFRTDAATAELVKLVENASRDVNIAFANELSLICDQLGLNVWHVIELANRHPRVSILQPGPGVGGHCIAVDPWFIISSAPERTRLIRTAREVNDAKPKFVVSQDPGTSRAVQATRRRLFGSDLQARCRRHAGEPGDRDRGAIGARRAGPHPGRRSEPDRAPRGTRPASQRVVLRDARGRTPGRHRGPSGGPFALSEDPARGVDAPRRHRRDRADPSICLASRGQVDCACYALA